MRSLRACLTLGLVALAPALGAEPLEVLDAPRAIGDADGDGRQEAALVVQAPGTTAHARVFVAVFEDQADGWELVAAVRLEDGARVDRLRLAPGVLTASFRRHYTIDAACCPSRETVRSYAVVDGTLVGDAVTVDAPAWAEAVATVITR